MISYKVHLIRTGSASEGPQKRYAGQSDLALCDKGREELRLLREKFSYPKADRVYSSPLSRCVQTAEILYPDSRPVLVEELKDMNLGAFEGKSFDELQGDAAFTGWLADSLNNTPPGGEKVEDFTARILSAMDKLVREMMRERVTSAAVVTHGGVLMSLMAAIALPRQPIHRWAANNGSGYTLLTNAQMWMRDKCAEAFFLLPESEGEGEQDSYSMYEPEN